MQTVPAMYVFAMLHSVCTLKLYFVLQGFKGQDNRVQHRRGGEAGMRRQYVCTITDDARHALIVSNYVILCGSVV